MHGVQLRFYTYETSSHHGMSVYEWLLEQAKKQGIHGGSAFRAIAGFGRHGKLHEQHFFELAGEVPVLVEFIMGEEQAAAFLALLRLENLDLFHSRCAVEYGFVAETR